jgi:hypothetical protein
MQLAAVSGLRLQLEAGEGIAKDAPNESPSLRLERALVFGTFEIVDDLRGALEQFQAIAVSRWLLGQWFRGSQRNPNSSKKTSARPSKLTKFSYAGDPGGICWRGEAVIAEKLKGLRVPSPLCFQR